jgi:hypothetical protein
MNIAFFILSDWDIHYKRQFFFRTMSSLSYGAVVYLLCSRKYLTIRGAVKGCISFNPLQPFVLIFIPGTYMQRVNPKLRDIDSSLHDVT